MRDIATIATPPQEASTRPDGGGFMSGGGWAKRPRADQIIGRARSARLGASHIAAAPRARARQDGDDGMEADPARHLSLPLLRSVLRIYGA